MDPDQVQVAAVQHPPLLSHLPQQVQQRSAAAGAVFAALPSRLMPEAFTGEGDFEENLQQFTTAADFKDGKQPPLIIGPTVLYLCSTGMPCISIQHSP